ncbi:helix-hairpin-helix domain-containing protein [Virgibacillus flavescens]|uniref:helix-hairpin-helix domain-containing protein n=1 Tax=Virgibacillus flavescens TaxID=1611422 RepID=UPI003D34411F
MKKTSPKLPLAPEERAALRKNKLKLSDIAQCDTEELASAMESTFDRAKYLRALSIFQAVPSIGPKLAKLVVELGYYEFEDFNEETGAELTNRAELLYGHWMDPCVEDTLRCVVHHATNRGSDKQWFDFTAERKAFRAKHGYPESRPKLAWHEDERYGE